MTERHMEGRTAIVTGAARGMGRTHALLLARLGASVVVNDVSPLAQQVVDEITAENGKAILSTLDTVDPSQAAELVKVAVDTFGGLHSIVCNAAIQMPLPFSDVTPDAWDTMMKVNAYAPFHLAQAAWPVFKDQKHGRIVFIGASSSFVAFENLGHYSAAKATLVGLAITMALEGKPLDITTNVIFPAAITQMSAAAMDQEYMDRVAPTMRPEFVSTAVAWLARPANRLNGEVLFAGANRVAPVVFQWGKGYWSRELSVDELIENEAAVLDRAGAIEMTGSDDFQPWMLDNNTGWDGSS